LTFKSSYNIIYVLREMHTKNQTELTALISQHKHNKTRGCVNIRKGD